MIQANSAIELLNKVQLEDLYAQLVQQLNKDFQMANVDYQFKETTLPKNLHEILSQILLKLINAQYDDYLNLLYRIDVAETDLLKVRSENLEESIEKVAFLILTREAQKVWLKRKFSDL